MCYRDIPVHFLLYCCCLFCLRFPCRANHGHSVCDTRREGTAFKHQPRLNDFRSRSCQKSSQHMTHFTPSDTNFYEWKTQVGSCLPFYISIHSTLFRPKQERSPGNNLKSQTCAYHCRLAMARPPIFRQAQLTIHCHRLSTPSRVFGGCHFSLSASAVYPSFPRFFERQNYPAAFHPSPHFSPAHTHDLRFTTSSLIATRAWRQYPCSSSNKEGTF